jgi:chlorobactene glucosyltransferase
MTTNSSDGVSVIIPARDEEANIARVVRSVAGQERVLEILVVDDQSQDRTPEILKELRREIRLLRVLKTGPLPDGWMGKNHAVATGAREAGGDWLLFTDADVVILPGAVSEMLERAKRDGVDLLSLSPGQETPTWWEKAVIPIVYVHLAQLYRFEDVSDSRSKAAAANGQFILIRRVAYDQAGGHEAIRGEILEDVELARRVKERGGKILFLPGARWVCTRMYTNWGAMWQGWTKTLYLIYNRRAGRMLATVAVQFGLDVLPALGLLLGCVWMILQRADSRPGWLVIACFAMLILRQRVYAHRLRSIGFNLSLARYAVPGAAIFSLLLLSSIRAHCLGGRLTWKGRVYSTKGVG